MTDTKDMPEPVAWRWTFDTWGGWSYGQTKPGKFTMGQPNMVEPLYSSAAITSLMAERDAAIARAERAERLLEEAMKALEPFSDIAGEMFGRNWGSSAEVLAMGTPENMLRITVGDFFAARAIVNKEGD